MIEDWFSLIEEGWNIIEQYPDARTSARHLCRLFSDKLEAASVGFEYHDNRNYSWKEQVDRIGMISSTGKWNYYLNNSKSNWFFDGGIQYIDDFKQVIALLSKQWLFKKSHLPIRNRSIKYDYTSIHDHSGWVAVSSASRKLLSGISQYFLNDIPILLVGEPGSGKKYLAKVIHRNSYNPASNLWDDSNNNRFGTLFVPDWASISYKRKKQFLDGERRIVASTTPAEFDDNMKNNWYRDTGNDGIIFKIPSLVERVEDIPLLTSYFIDKVSVFLSRNKAPVISESVKDILYHYSWPGNIRELKETLIHALHKCPENSETIELEHLPIAIRTPYSGKLSLEERLAQIEQDALEMEIKRHNGRLIHAAKALKMTLRQLKWRIQKYNIDLECYKPSKQSKNCN